MKQNPVFPFVLIRNPIKSHVVYVRIRFHNRFICVGIDISVYVLPTGGRI